MNPIMLVIVLVVGLASAGCTKSAAVESRFARDFSCPVDEISVRDLGGGQFYAHGCNRGATYTCVRESSLAGPGMGDVVCTMERGRPTP